MEMRLNKTLVWDYEISPEDLKREDFFILYLSRVLNNGCLRDVQEIPLDIIERYLDRLHISSEVKKFWTWYLRMEKK